ncbi:MAG: phosphohistidine phosphatase SixA [Endozoicomonadaceae bacterium]|nr:phosphohistidine phosphatase SixA [Endozoicomonadaceae bacterium]
MKLYIMRHGKAESYAESDQVRPLSDVGRKQVADVAKQMSDLSLSGIMASPYLRAWQTAELMQATLSTPMIQRCDSFTPDSSVHEVLRNLPKSGDWLLVSHMPLVSLLTGLLIEDDQARDVLFSTAMVVGLDMPEASPRLARVIQQWLP